ncbi:nucleoside hydrolase [Nocardia takedensis]|uniref:nucleoside hydrolase n=1 Tax=Nocardia takedensis TaxID=259390 RepID=UPI00030250C3|nr:nucleoside hydrolase [Nocardia takedensis]
MPHLLTSADPGRAEPEGDGLTLAFTDLFFDPDDLVMLVILARVVSRFVVVTSDEVGGLRAQGARGFLDSLGRTDVQVVQGIDLGGKRRYLADPGQVVPDYVHPGLEERLERESAMVETLTTLILNANGPVRCVGCASMTELAALLSASPDLGDKLILTQMGGWLDHYRDPTRASHNFHIDQVSAGLALRLVPRPRLVLSEHTNNDAIRITNDSPLVEALAADCAPTWARTLSIQLDRWFRVKGGSWMHDPLTLSASLGLPFVTFGSETIRIGADGRIHRDPHGRPVQVSTAVDYPGFLDWMNHLVSTW